MLVLPIGFASNDHCPTDQLLVCYNFRSSTSTTKSHMLPQKKRKQRKVKNALVDIDCSVEPGTNYRNWIEITKQKLKVLLNDNHLYTDTQHMK